jgi:hypothetical protein
MATTLQHVSAYQKAVRRQIVITQPFDWQILLTLHELAKPCSMQAVLKYYTNHFGEAYNSRYYNSLKRLEKARLIDETRVYRGYGRRWKINSRGIVALNNLEQLAARILSAETAQGS